MYSAVIANAEDLSKHIMGIHAIPQTAPVIKQVTSFADTQIPAMKTLAKDVTGYVGPARISVTGMLGKIGAGTAPSDLRPEVDALKTQVGSLETEADATRTGVTTFRDGFAKDCADLQAAMISMNAQIAGLQAQAQRNQKKASELAHRIKVINAMMVIPGIGGLVKLASELANLISEHKLTEQSLADASREVAKVRAMQNQIRMAESQTQEMETLVTQLSNGTQSVANAIDLIAGKLSNEDQFLKAEPDAAKLYLTALGSSLSQLETIVS